MIDSYCGTGFDPHFRIPDHTHLSVIFLSGKDLVTTRGHIMTGIILSAEQRGLSRQEEAGSPFPDSETLVI